LRNGDSFRVWRSAFGVWRRRCRCRRSRRFLESKVNSGAGTGPRKLSRLIEWWQEFVSHCDFAQSPQTPGGYAGQVGVWCSSVAKAPFYATASKDRSKHRSAFGAVGVPGDVGDHGVSIAPAKQACNDDFGWNWISRIRPPGKNQVLPARFVALRPYRRLFCPSLSRSIRRKVTFRSSSIVSRRFSIR